MNFELSTQRKTKKKIKLLVSLLHRLLEAVHTSAVE